MSTKSSRSFADIAAPVLFGLGVAAIIFGLGFLSARFKVFPYSLLAGAESAARGVWEAYLRPPPFERPGQEGTPSASKGIVHDKAAMAPGLTFLSAYTLDGYGARLVDPEGKLVHEWRGKFSDIFKDASHLRWQARDEVISWHGVHLFENGDVVFNFQDASFPYGGGLVRIDKDSNVLWTLARNTHHDVFVDDEDGTIWVAAQHFRDEGVEGFPNLKGGYYEDTVLQVSPEGEVLREVSILDALRAMPGLLDITYDFGLDVESEDPTHLNNIDILSPAQAGTFPGLDAGDIMVSLRNINAVVFIDGETGRAKRAITGLFVRQHDPDFLDDGSIMVFDNRGGDPACGGSRILEIDPVSQATVWAYTGCDGEPFYSEARGEQAVLANGNVLIVESQAGRLLEVTHEAEPRVVWEYYNVLGELDGRPRVGLITHAQRMRPENLTFLNR